MSYVTLRRIVREHFCVAFSVGKLTQKSSRFDPGTKMFYRHSEYSDYVPNKKMPVIVTMYQEPSVGAF